MEPNLWKVQNPILILTLPHKIIKISKVPYKNEGSRNRQKKETNTVWAISRQPKKLNFKNCSKKDNPQVIDLALHLKVKRPTPRLK